MKQTATINQLPVILGIMQSEAERLKLSRNVLIESQSIVSAYERGVPVTHSQIAEMVSGFSTNEDGKIDARFRNNIGKMPPEAQWSVCAFFSGLNLLGDVHVTTQAQANLRKGGADDFVCYFAVNNFGGRDIEKIIQNKIYVPVGNPAGGGIVYLTRLQQLINPKRIYPKWEALLRSLESMGALRSQSLEDIDGLRVEHTELVRSILSAIGRL